LAVVFGVARQMLYWSAVFWSSRRYAVFGLLETFNVPRLLAWVSSYPTISLNKGCSAPKNATRLLHSRVHIETPRPMVPCVVYAWSILRGVHQSRKAGLTSIDGLTAEMQVKNHVGADRIPEGSSALRGPWSIFLSGVQPSRKAGLTVGGPKTAEMQYRSLPGADRKPEGSSALRGPWSILHDVQPSRKDA